MTDVIELSDRLWRGEATVEEHHPFAPRGELTEVADGCGFVPSFANVSAFATDDGLVLVDVGGMRFELHHARGETDDHTWTWVPATKVLCCGDFFIWASPNAGNPQKVQRYPREWAVALREMAALGAEVLLPGHGLPVVGADRVRQALTETAELLESLHDQAVDLMNAGARPDELVHTVPA